MSRKLSEYIYLGRASFTGEPVLISSKVLAHLHGLGRIGSGKTHRLLVSVIRQLARMGGWSIYYFDLKKDKAMVRTLAWIAREAGIPFKVFTSDPRERSHLYNPFRQRHRKDLTHAEASEIILAALGMDYGEGYGESFYSAANKQVMTRALERLRIDSFASLARQFADPAARRKLELTDRGWENASHVLMAVEGLAKIPAFNLGPGEVSDRVADSAIELTDGIETPSINVFVTPTMTQAIANRGMARCGVHDLVAAAGLQADHKVQALVVLDDCDQIMTKSLSTLASQSRDRGISLGLVHQSMSQLKTKDHDYIPEVVVNSRTKVYFGPFSDKDAADIIARMSGEQPRLLVNSGPHGLTEVEQYAPRLGVEELKEVGRVPGRAIVDVRPGLGLTQMRHPIVVDLPFTMSPEQFAEIASGPWPGDDDETIVAANHEPPKPPPPPNAEDRPLPLKKFGAMKRTT